jgi:hypothetical protein
MIWTGLVLALPLSLHAKSVKPEEIWGSATVRNRVGSVVLRLLAIDEKPCYATPPKYGTLEKCMRSTWGPITKAVDAVLLDKSFSGDVVLVQLLDFHIGNFKETVEEAVVQRGAKMLPLLDYWHSNSVCAQTTICRTVSERDALFEELKSKIGQKPKK